MNMRESTFHSPEMQKQKGENDSLCAMKHKQNKTTEEYKN